MKAFKLSLSSFFISVLILISGCESARKDFETEKKARYFLDQCKVANLVETDDRVFTSYKAICPKKTFDCTSHIDRDEKWSSTYCKDPITDEKFRLTMAPGFLETQ